MKSELDEALDRGIERFNRGEFWHAHEEWESVWLHERGEARDFLQGLIQLAAAWYHVGRHNWRGAQRLFDAALTRLDRYGPSFCGVDRAAAVEQARSDRAALARGENVELPVVFLSRSGRDFRTSEK